jgi:hypothetical protein
MVTDQRNPIPAHTQQRAAKPGYAESPKNKGFVGD